MTAIWILGASDPEMAAIEQLLDVAGETVRHATADDRRVIPGNAYRMDALSEPLPWGGEVVLVECDCADPWPVAADGAALPYRLVLRDAAPDEPSDADYLRVYRVDHHRPGDPGFGRGPAEFMASSSLGQVIARLAGAAALPWPTFAGGGSGIGEFVRHLNGWAVRIADQDTDGQNCPAAFAVIPQDLILTAAADHCLGAAYCGECPGVEPDALAEWRAKSRAELQQRSVEAVLADVQAAKAALLAAPRVNGVAILDAPIPECPDAAAQLGIAFRVTLTERGQRKEVLQVASPAQVGAFLAEHRAAGRQPYGDPARGFAGVAL